MNPTDILIKVIPTKKFKFALTSIEVLWLKEGS